MVASFLTWGYSTKLTGVPLPNARCQHALLPHSPAQRMCRAPGPQRRCRDLDHLGRSTLERRGHRPTKQRDRRRPTADLHRH